jgi:hypothetical protein
MAYTEIFPDKDTWRNEIKNQIAEFLPGMRHRLPKEIRNVQLGESFKIWELDTQRLLTVLGTGLGALSRESERWHHQVFVNEVAQAYAESRLEDGDNVHVYQLSVSPLAGKIDQAIDLVDSSSDQVRFLCVPPFRLFAFWMVESTQVYLLDAPATFVRVKPYLGHVLSEGDFITLLRADLKAVPEKKLDVESR